ncbi:MAG: hypothetical protein KGQ26_07555 [Rhodospirillales bacterium]|nr:hypothetical protein [Rhodospirillales bacterium]
MDRDTLLLSATLCILSLGVVALGLDLLAGERRKAASAAPPQDDLRVFLRLAPPMPIHSPAGPVQTEPTGYEKPPLPEDFVFRRHAFRNFASMEISHKRFHPPSQDDATSPAHTEFSAIRSEICATLDAATPTAPRQPPSVAQLLWTEADRLAVLSLAGAAPATGHALLKRHRIGTLIAAPGHPFDPAEEGIEILILPEGLGATSLLAATLRAKLAQGERIAFHTEAGLSGAAAMLAARFSSRRASQP